MPFHSQAGRFGTGTFADTVPPEGRYTPKDPLEEFEHVDLDMWRAVDGSRVFQDTPKVSRQGRRERPAGEGRGGLTGRMRHQVTLPDGSRAILYANRKTRVDEIQVGWPSVEPAPLTLQVPPPLPPSSRLHSLACPCLSRAMQISGTRAQRSSWVP